jgi:hypothetical protein
MEQNFSSKFFSESSSREADVSANCFHLIFPIFPLVFSSDELSMSEIIWNIDGPLAVLPQEGDMQQNFAKGFW